MNKSRLFTQLLLLFAGATVVISALLVVLGVFQLRSIIENNMETRSRTLIEATANIVVVPMYSGNIRDLQRVMATVVSENGVDSVAAFEPSGHLLLTRTMSDTNTIAISEDDTQAFVIEAAQSLQTQLRVHNNALDVAAPVIVNNKAIGVLVGRASLAQINEQVMEFLPGAIAAGVGVSLLGALLAFLIARHISTPLYKLAQAAESIGRGELDTPLPAQRGGEIGALSNAFAHMLTNLRAARNEVDEQQRTLEQRVVERTADLQRALVELRESANIREQLSATVRELASPVVPVMEGILVMPLVGVIDSQRARLMTESLLAAVESRRADVVILDVTGVPLVDTQVAKVLLQSAEAVSLLGAQTVLVGLRPEVAQTIVGLGLNLSSLVTLADLQSGVAYAMKRREARWTSDGRPPTADRRR